MARVKRLCQRSVQDDGIIIQIVKSVQSFKNENTWDMFNEAFSSNKTDNLAYRFIVLPHMFAL